MAWSDAAGPGVETVPTVTLSMSANTQRRGQIVGPEHPHRDQQPRHPQAAPLDYVDRMRSNGPITSNQAPSPERVK
jgi:hypothetical protein